MCKTKLALVICPCWTNFTPPLGIAYLASASRIKGYEVKCFDINIELYNLLKGKTDDYWDFKEHYRWQDPYFSQYVQPLIGDYLRNKAQEILSFNPDIIGFSVFYTNAAASLFLAQEIKKRDSAKKIIFGGQECFKESSNPRFLNSGFVDAVVVGEGEETLEELLRGYAETALLNNIKGAIIKTNGKKLNTGLREEIKDLDLLPFPDYNDFNLKLYKRFALPIMTSRGCIARCAFCGEIRYWKNFRFRSAENVFSELKKNIERYGIKDFFFNDSLINGNLKELLKLTDSIIKNELDINWGGYARVNPGLTLDFLKKLNKSGCHYLSYGIESGSQKVVNAMNKNISLKDASMNLENTVKAGIEAHVNWIVGFPNESWLDFLKSLIFIYKNRRNISHFNPGQVPCGVLPESGLALNPKKFKIADRLFLNNWRTKFFTNTIIHRQLRLQILRKWISLLGISYS